MPATARALAPLLHPALHPTTVIGRIETRAVVLTDQVGSPGGASLAPVLRVAYQASVLVVDRAARVLYRELDMVTPDGSAAADRLCQLVRDLAPARHALPVALVSAGDDPGRDLARDALSYLAATGTCDRWREVIDPAALRGKLRRALAVVLPDQLARERLQGRWELSLLEDPSALHQIIDTFSAATADLHGSGLAAVAATIGFLRAHSRELAYAEQRRAGIIVPMVTRTAAEPLRISRARFRRGSRL